MQWVTDGERWRAWLVDYNAARPGAIGWVDGRYVAAGAPNQISGSSLREHQRSASRTAIAPPRS